MNQDRKAQGRQTGKWRPSHEFPTSKSPPLHRARGFQAIVHLPETRPSHPRCTMSVHRRLTVGTQSHSHHSSVAEYRRRQSIKVTEQVCNIVYQPFTKLGSPFYPFALEHPEISKPHDAAFKVPRERRCRSATLHAYGLTNEIIRGGKGSVGKCLKRRRWGFIG